jgi:hypothetical protein
LNQKNPKNVYSLLQNRHLKSKIDCKNNGKWKLQTCFSWNYDFVLTNLLKNGAAQLYDVSRSLNKILTDQNCAVGRCITASG